MASMSLRRGSGQYEVGEGQRLGWCEVGKGALGSKMQGGQGGNCLHHMAVAMASMRWGKRSC